MLLTLAAETGGTGFDRVTGTSTALGAVKCCICLACAAMGLLNFEMIDWKVSFLSHGIFRAGAQQAALLSVVGEQQFWMIGLLIGVPWLRPSSLARFSSRV